jgi:hypothetical protein
LASKLLTFLPAVGTIALWFLGIVSLWTAPIAFFALMAVCVSVSVGLNRPAQRNLKDLPSSGYEGYLLRLKSKHPVITASRFEQIDGFFVDGISKVLSYVYRHPDVEGFLCHYALSNADVLDLHTELEGDRTCTTVSSLNGAVDPKPPNHFVQVVETDDPAELMRRHTEGLEYLAKCGVHPVEIPPSDFRRVFAQRMAEDIKAQGFVLFYVIRLMAYMATKRAQKHLASIEQQHRDGVIKRI